MNGNCFPPSSPSGPRAIPRFGPEPEPEPPFGPAPVLPGGRLARIAARRRFVEMKQSFMAAADQVRGPSARSLRARVRRADDPFELLALQCDLMHALPPGEESAETSRMEIERHIDLLFPDVPAPAGPSAGR